MQGNMSTCLSNITQNMTDSEDKEQLTLKEELCDNDSDLDYPDDDDDIDISDNESFVQRFFQSSHCTVCMYLSITLIIVGCIVALIVIAAQVVVPYSNVTEFLNGTCIPSKLHVEFGQTCMCGTGCTASYRCLMIRVIYQDRNKKWKNATLYENESTLGRKVSIFILLPKYHIGVCF